MPPRDASKVQLDFPVLTADLIDQLRLTGVIGVMDFLPEVRPTFIIGARGLTATVNPPTFLQSEIFSVEATNPAANSVVVDTGQLAAGDYDVVLAWGQTQTTVQVTSPQMQLRDAADAVTLLQWFLPSNIIANVNTNITFAINILLNQRIRLFTGAALIGNIGGTIMAKRRVVP